MKVWARARANAFAHRAAASRFKCLSRILFFLQVLFGLSSLFLVIVLYAFISGEPAVAAGKTPLFLTLSSVFYTIISILITVMQNYLGFDQSARQHDHNQHSFLYLAQRSREIDSPGMLEDDAQALIDDLERDFQILKVRGEEPSDRHFRIGHTYLKGISESQFSKLQTGELSQIDGKSKGEKNELDEESSETGSRVYEKTKRNEVTPFEWYMCEIVAVISAALTIALWAGTAYVTAVIYEQDLNAGQQAVTTDKSDDTSITNDGFGQGEEDAQPGS